MNPAGPQTPQPIRPIQDVTASPISTAEAAELKPSFVENIPLRTQAGAGHEDADLDAIMQDVGQDLKKVDERPKKRGLFSKKPKPAPRNPAPAHQPAAQPQPAQSTAAAQPAAKAPPAPKSSTPVFVIFMTIIVTGALIAAAYYSYK
jgi:hypothetical protein